MTDLDETIRRVRELSDAATKGPWRSCDHAGWAYPFVSVVCERDRDVIAPDGRYPNDPEVIGRTCMTRGKIQDELANAALIAHYRTAAPLLADECERLLERVRVLEEALRQCAADGECGLELGAQGSRAMCSNVAHRARAALKGGE